jgi:signal transduction histidine kinase
LFRVIAWSGFVLVAGGIIAALAVYSHERERLGWSLLVWIALVAVAGITPVRLRGVEFVMDLPILLAAALVLGPVGSGIAALVGATDIRELRGQWSSRSLWNRAQTAICTMAASGVFVGLSGELRLWPQTGLVALLALGVDMILNYVFVSLGASLLHEQPISASLREMTVGARSLFLLTHVGFGYTGVLIAELHEAIGLTGVVVSLIPVTIAYQGVHRRRELDESAQVIRAKEGAVVDAIRRMVAERRDERMGVAGALHDAVLPSLFKVQLMGQVVMRDLESGRLLDLDRDVPELVDATQAAQGALRDVVRDLREATLAPGGLESALRLLVTELEGAGLLAVRLSVDCVGGSAASQLLAFQVVREALTNAAKHAKASAVSVDVWSDQKDLRITVNDDGVGFVWSHVNKQEHFGLQFISERVEAAGGRLVVDSRLGEGTLVACRLPLEL